jgi:dCTP deaminase
MILSDRTIMDMLLYPQEYADPIRVTPTPEKGSIQFQPASIDLRLGTGFSKYDLRIPPGTQVHVDDFEASREMRAYEEDRLRILPGEFILGTTAERVYIPKNMLGYVDGRSSIGRMGLLIHVTAGLLDPGFEGQITLEFYNVGPRPIVIPSGTRICQVSFHTMDFPSVRPYGHPELFSKYQHQTGVTASRVRKDRE